jgi:hypothetical protein
VIFSSAFDGQETPPREITLPASNGKTDPEWRIYARSASDDKAPIVAILRAVDALRAGNLPLTSNIKFFFEGEEEAGSPISRSLVPSLQMLTMDRLRRRAMDTKPATLLWRASHRFELTVYGPRRELHSGHYGTGHRTLQ